MTPAGSPLDIAAYARDGFGVVRAAVSPALLGALSAAVDRVQANVAHLPPDLRERLVFQRDLSERQRGDAPLSAIGDAVYILGDPVAFDDAFWSVLRAPLITAAIRQAVGVPDIAAHFMNVTTKHPRIGNRIFPHRDFPNRYACPDRPCFVRAMLCLDGMTERGGATTFLPGSHLHDDPAPDDASFVAVPCDPGDLVVIHPRVLHGGGPNTSARPRRNVILQAGDAAAPLLQVPDREAVAGHRLG